MKVRRWAIEEIVPTTGQIGLAFGLLLFTCACLFWPHRSAEDEGEPADQAPENASVVKAVAPKLQCLGAGCLDQADTCVWVPPNDHAQSTIIATDKKAAALFVYDLDGKVIQSIPANRPGGVDVRYGFRLGGQAVDLVAYNERRECKILVYKVDPQNRKLERIDNDSITTGRKNHDGTLYRSPKTGRFYFVTTSESEDTEQYELADDDGGNVGGKKVRSWRIAMAQTAVADDEMGNLYIAEGHRGVWEIGGEPDDPTTGQLIIQRGQNGLEGDIEGLALYDPPGGDDYLIVSNRRANNFKVYQRASPHRFIGTFAVDGARRTDWLEVCNADLGSRFPRGIFVCHTANAGRPILVTPWEEVAKAVPSELQIKTSWERRAWASRAPEVRAGER